MPEASSKYQRASLTEVANTLTRDEVQLADRASDRSTDPGVRLSGYGRGQRAHPATVIERGVLSRQNSSAINDPLG